MNIKDIRQLTGLSQSKFADKFNLPVRTLQKWERNGSTPPDYVIELITYRMIAEKHMPDSVRTEVNHDMEQIYTLVTESKVNDKKQTARRLMNYAGVLSTLQEGKDRQGKKNIVE